MLRRLTGTAGLRRLLPALLLAVSLAAPATLMAQAAPDPGADPNPPVSTPAPTTAPDPAPAPSSAPAAPAQPQATAKSSASTSVSIVDFAFDPGAITVHTGDTVQWTDNGTDPKGHTVTGSGFDSGILQTGAVFSFNFPVAGTFSYACSVHPSMKGTVRVLAASTGSGNSQGSGKKKSGSSGSSGGGSGSSTSNAPGPAPAAGGSGSESAAVSSPGAAGSDASLPSTGSDSLLLASIGMLLLDLGLALRLVRSLVRPRR